MASLIILWAVSMLAVFMLGIAVALWIKQKRDLEAIRNSKVKLKKL